MPKILVVEDQEGPWRSIHRALVEISSVDEKDITRARWYQEAMRMISGGTQFDFILLDHLVPLYDPGCTDESDFDRFVMSLDGRGYGLVNSIQAWQPKAVVIGTSSMSKDELGIYTAPSITVDKLKIDDELWPILQRYTPLS